LSSDAEEALGDVPRYLDVDSTPVLTQVAGHTAVLVGAYQGGVFALDAETGNQIWSNPGVQSVTDVTLWSQAAHTATDGTPYPARELLIANTGTTGLWALDTQTGEDLWRRDLPGGGTSRPAVLLGALFFTTTHHGAFLLSPLGGAIIDGVHTGAGFSMPPVAAGHRAFVLSNSGELLAFSVATP
jgi:outer membrane protein assembly factor BamB